MTGISIDTVVEAVTKIGLHSSLLMEMSFNSFSVPELNVSSCAKLV